MWMRLALPKNFRLPCKKLVIEIHSSLCCGNISDKEKCFTKLTPGGNVIKHFYVRNLIVRQNKLVRLALVNFRCSTRFTQKY
jgi:hypothetical protein